MVGSVADQGAVAYSLNTTSLDISTLTVQPFSASNSFTVPACKETDFQVWHTAPVFSNGWALLGELTKWVPVAEARISSVSVSDADVIVNLMGEAGENVPLTFYNPGTSNTTTLACVLDAAGRARAIMPIGVCQ